MLVLDGGNKGGCSDFAAVWTALRFLGGPVC